MRAIRRGIWTAAFFAFACSETRREEPPIDDGGTGPECSVESCAGCCTPAGCVVGTDVTQCGKGGAACLDCSGQGLCTAEGRCAIAPDRGDSCASPLTLAVEGGSTTITGTLAARADDASFGCGGAGGVDLVFRADVTTAGTLHLRFSQDGGGRPLVALRRACDERGSEVSGGCATGFISTPAALDADVTAGTWFVWIDANGVAGGPFTLAASLSTGEGDRCDKAWPLPLSHDAANVSGGFLGTHADRALACNSFDGPDVFYSVDVPRRANLIAVARGSGGRRVSLQASRACTGSPLACTESDSAGIAEVRETVDAGAVILGLESSRAASEGTASDYSLDVRLAEPPANDACAGAVALDLSSGHARVAGTTADAADDAPASCVEGGGDVYYRFTTNSVLDLDADVQAGEPDGRPGIALIGSHCGTTVRGCAQPSYSGSTHLTFRGLPPGTYDLVVDSAPGHAGRFTLDVTTAARPSDGETCAGAKTLAFTTNADGSRTASATEDIHRYAKDDPLDCSDGWNIQHDVSWAFTLSQATNLTVAASWAAVDGGILYLRVLKADCMRDHSLACNGEYMNDIDPVELGAVPPGEYRITLSAFLIDDTVPTNVRLDVSAVPAPQGEGCANPTELVFPQGDAGGQVTVSGDTTNQMRDVAYSCGSSSSRSTAGRDVVYAFATTQPMNLSASATTTDGYFRLALYLRRGSECADGDELACDTDGGSWNADKHVEIAENALPAGRYVLVVDASPRPSYTSDKSGGPYQLVVGLTPTLPGETCENPLPLAFSNGAAGGTATVTSTTVGMLNDMAVCVGSGPDVVYSFTTDRELDFRAIVTTSTGPRAKAYLSRGVCNSATDAVCAYDNASSGPFTLSVGSLAAGSYKLVVDGDSSYGGSAYTLAASLSAHQPGETCVNPLPLAFTNGPAGGTASTTGDLSAFFEQGTPCGDSDPDAVYTFTIDRVLNLVAKVEPDAGAQSQATLSLVRNCASIGWSDCSASPFLGKAEIQAAGLTPGTYLLALDGKGPYRLSATLSAPVAGDGCTNPLSLFPAGQSSGSVTLHVDPTGTFDDLRPPCASYSSGTQDVFYRFTTAAPTAVRAVATTVQPHGYGPYLYIVPAGCTGTSPVCNASVSGRTSTLEKSPLPAGDWLLVVDTKGDYDMYRGPFDVAVTVGPPPAGDSCANAVSLGIPAAGGEVTVTGDTTDFFDDLDATCEAHGQKTPGHDAVYRFETTAVMNLRTLVRAGNATYKPSLYHASAASGGCAYDSRMCAYVPLYSDWEMADFAALPAGTHYLVVDAASGAGPFTLTARLMPVAQGESCANPRPLALSSGTAHVTGDIRDWFPDTTPSSQGNCGSSMTSGEDAVYSFSTNAARYFRATLATTAPETDYLPALYLRSGTCTGTEKDCQTGSGGTATIAASVASGQHFLFVDSTLRQQSHGAYTLDVFVGDPPQGDTCANPIPLTLSNGASGGTVRVQGDTTTFLPDTTPGCGNSYGSPSALGRDVVYSFAINRTLNLTAKLEMTTSGYDGVLTLRSSCGGAEVACVGGAGAYSPKTITRQLSAGTHYLTIDNGMNARGRTYTLDVTLAP